MVMKNRPANFSNFRQADFALKKKFYGSLVRSVQYSPTSPPGFRDLKP
jgi:hypothetical protein